MPSSSTAALESQEGDEHSEASRTFLWPLRISRHQVHITRQIIVFFSITILGAVGLWYSMTTMISSSQVPTFVPQSAVITVPGTNITIPARPAAFGPMFSDNSRMNASFEEVVEVGNEIAGNPVFPSSRVLAFLGPRVPEALKDEGVEDLEDLESPEIGGFTGSLKAIDSLGCEEPTSLTDYRGKIALVERGGCSFYDKVMVLQKGGAVAVIVGDNVYRRGLVTMYTENDDGVAIPSVFVSRESYNILKDVDLVTISTVDVGSSVIGTVIFLMVSPLCSLSLIYCVLLFHRRYKQLQERASKSTVAKLPTRIWVRPTPPVPEREENNEPTNETQHTESNDTESSDNSGVVDLNEEGVTAPQTSVVDAEDPEEEKPWVSSGECIICMEDYISGVSKVMRLPCYHEFHVKCITRWLTTRKKTCPICKYDITLGKRVPFSTVQQPSSDSALSDSNLESGLPIVESSRCPGNHSSETSRLLEPNESGAA